MITKTKQEIPTLHDKKIGKQLCLWDTNRQRVTEMQWFSESLQYSCLWENMRLGSTCRKGNGKRYKVTKKMKLTEC